MAFSEFFRRRSRKPDAPPAPAIELSALDLIQHPEVNLLARVGADGTLREVLFARPFVLPGDDKAWVGHSIESFVKGDWVAAGTEKLRKAVEINQEYTFTHTFGSGHDATTLEFKIVPTGADDAYVILRDITARSQLESRLLQLNRTLLSLQAASTSVTASLDLTQILDAFTWEASTLLNADGCAVYLVNPAGDALERQAMASTDPDLTAGFPERLDLTGLPLFQTVIAERSARQITFNLRPKGSGESQLLADLIAQLLLLVPLVFQDEVVGLVLVRNARQKANYADQEIALVQLLSNQTAAAIMNATLFQKAQEEIEHRKVTESILEQERALLAQRVDERTAELRVQLEQQQALAAIETTIAHPDGLAINLKQIANIVAANLLPDCGAVIVLHDADTEQVPLAIFSENMAAIGELGGNWHDEETVGWVLAQQEPFVATDLSAAPLQSVKQLQEAGFERLIAAPIYVDNRCLGILYAFCQQPRSFSTAEQRFVSALANRAGLSIANLILIERMKAANDELTRAAQIKDEFLASMSHELRTPLHAILGLTEALQEQSQGLLGSDQLYTLEIVQQSGAHLLAIIDGILDIARFDAGVSPLEIRQIDVTSVCQQSLKIVSTIAKEKDITLHASIAPEVKTVPGDLRRLRQVLLNLLNNAIKFTPAGGAVGIEATKAPDGESIGLTVWDTGIGIPESEWEAVFEPFSQLDSRLDREYPGIGLGLALVERMVHSHGGQVSVTSEIDQGSRFTVTLPLLSPGADRPGQHDTPYLAEAPLSPKGETAVADSFTILLVEPDDGLRPIFQSALTRDGYHVLTARSGQEAVTLCRRSAPDLLLLDLPWSEPGSIETLAQLVEPAGTIDIPAILLVGSAEEVTEPHLNQSAVTAVKPVSMRRIRQLVRAQLIDANNR